MNVCYLVMNGEVSYRYQTEIFDNEGLSVSNHGMIGEVLVFLE
jgi:hypothetical protein